MWRQTCCVCLRQAVRRMGWKRKKNRHYQLRDQRSMPKGEAMPCFRVPCLERSGSSKELETGDWIRVGKGLEIKGEEAPS